MDMLLHVCVFSMSSALAITCSSDWSLLSYTAKVVQNVSLNADKKVSFLHCILEVVLLTTSLDSETG